ncbi:MAG: biopolymer transporter ExbD [Ectothiorhodospiraceae bacterium]|nr:biopolymer transporter ExbD [Ectothiorhodospiraceae bacterium]
MRLPEAPRREPAENIIPLINIVFLLLIFFMLAGALTRPDVLDVRPPETQAGDPAELPDEGVILLAADGRLAFAGRELEPRALEREVADWLADGPERRLTLKADADVAADRLLDLLDLLRDAGADHLMMLTNPSER